MVGERPLVHLLQEFVETRAIGEALVADSERRTRRSTIGQTRLLRNDIDRVDPEAIDPPVEPPVHHLVDGVTNLRIFPVQVGLLACEKVEVVLARGRVVLPRRTAEKRLPVRWLSSGSTRGETRARIPPVVPVSARRAGARSRFNEPGMLDRRVVDNEIHDDAHTQVVGARDEGIESLEIAK